MGLSPSALAAIVLLLPLSLLLGGCGGCADSAASFGVPGLGESTDQWQRDRFSYAVDNLNRLEDFDWAPPSDREVDPLLATCLRSDMLRQIVEWLNQWVRTQEPPANWQPDDLLATLAKPLREIPMVQDLGKMEFSRYDALALREAMWLRDVSSWARGDDIDELARAQRLFDWTVRNIQLESAGPRESRTAEDGSEFPERIPQFPWETLLFGRGTALDRAWVYILLARQQGLDAVLLGLADPADTTGKAPQPWVVAVLIERKLYLFDPELGLPIPAPDRARSWWSQRLAVPSAHPLPAPESVKLDKSGELAIEPATLAEVVNEPGLLRQMDADAAHPYPVKAADLKHVVALVEASPAYLSMRMELAGGHLLGEQTIVLTTAASDQAKRLEATPHVAEARLWTLPYETFYRRLHLSGPEIRRRIQDYWPFIYVADPEAPLHKGRLLYLKGKLTGRSTDPESATSYFQKARKSEKRLAELQNTSQNDIYQQSLALIRTLPENQRKAALERLKAVAVQQAGLYTDILRQAKQDASYWLGLIKFQQGIYPTAVDYLATRTLEAVTNSRWTHGARYNLARCYEASGQPVQAIKLYRLDVSSPGYHGNVLRARWLAAASKRPGGRS
jgi:tetratricopeptide (TPR) repeat protein